MGEQNGDVTLCGCTRERVAGVGIHSIGECRDYWRARAEAAEKRAAELEQERDAWREDAGRLAKGLGDSLRHVRQCGDCNLAAWEPEIRALAAHERLKEER